MIFSSNLIECLALVLIATCSGSNLSEITPGIEPETTGKEVPSSAYCPEPEEVYPCSCITYQGNFRDMDCSNVTSENELKSIFERDFPTDYLMKFIMDGNRNIRTLSAGVFGKKTFEAFVITNGVLEKVEPKAFVGSVSSLRNIDLGSNELMYFPFEEIPQYKNLDSLNLRENKITISSNIVSHSLMDVHFDNNPIGHIPADFLQDVPELQIFTCASCELEEILTGTFSRGPRLRYVDLAHNELTSLQEGAVDLDPSSSVLLLSYNKLSTVTAGAINGITSEMDVDVNQFEQLYEDVWRTVFEKTTSFSISHNPLLCDCDMAWLITNPELMEKISGMPKCKNELIWMTLIRRIIKKCVDG